MRVVVDANVAIAALMANGSVRDVLLNSTTLDFFAPEYLKSEIARHEADVVSRSHLDPTSVRALLEDVTQVIQFVPSHAYAARTAEARRLAAQAHADRDEEYIALARWLDAPVWTLDNDFRRIKRLRVLRTNEADQL
jgi:predicted nucleic acid-binding protein